MRCGARRGQPRTEGDVARGARAAYDPTDEAEEVEPQPFLVRGDWRRIPAGQTVDPVEHEGNMESGVAMASTDELDTLAD